MHKVMATLGSVMVTIVAGKRNCSDDGDTDLLNEPNRRQW